MGKQPADTGTLGKAIAVLEVVASSPRQLRFTDLLSLVDQPRGTLHRQISNLIDEGLLEVNADHSYALGLRLLTFASNAWASNKFRNIAEPHLNTLHEKVGETIHLGVLQGLDVVYLDKVESSQAVRMHSQIGNVSPCFCTGVGKAAFSLLPEDIAEERIAQIEFRPFTPTTITSADAFRDEIRLIRAKGYAFDHEEHEAGIHCIAAPISPRASNSIYAGISITAPIYRVPMARLESWSDLVRETAEKIAEDMSTKLGPRG